MSLLKPAAVVVTGLLAVTVSTHANSLVLNGGFEDPQLSVQSGFNGPASNWSSVGGNNLYLINGTFFGLSPYEGNQYMNFNAGDSPMDSAIEQTFSTVPGTSYTVSYVVGSMGGGILGVPVGLLGEILSASNSVLGSAQNYTDVIGWLNPTSFQFTATSSTTTLRFTDISQNTYSEDICFDAVSVTANSVPDSTPFAFSAGLVALAGFGRMIRRR